MTDQEKKLRPGTTPYVRLHQEVERQRGKAREHVCRCGSQAAQWANLSGEYLGIEDFEAMCVSCHRSMDERRGHDEREDHVFEPHPKEPRCQVCRRRQQNARHRERMKNDPAYAERHRESTRSAQRRYRERSRS